MTLNDNTRHGAVRGILWMVLATLLSAAAAAIVRKLSADFSTFELVFFHSLIAVLVLSPWLLRQSAAGIAASCRLWRLYLVRSVLAFLGITGGFYAFAHVPIADVFALQFTTPLFTIVLAVLLLRERVGVRGWFAVLIGFSGALVILRPGLIVVSLGALAALASAVFFAGANITIRVLARSQSPYAITAYANLLTLPVALVAALFSWTTPEWHHFPWIVALGTFNALNQICLARSVGAADARVVQPFNFVRLLWGVGLGFVLFAELPDVWTWIGAAIIFGSSLEVLQREAGRRAAARNGKGSP